MIKHFSKAILPGFLSLFLCAASLAKDIESHLGFTAQIDDKWICLSKEEVSKNAELFENCVKGVLANARPEVLENVKRQLTSGNMVIIYCVPSSSRSFGDNVNITKSLGSVPKSGGDMEKLKRELSAAIGGALGKKDFSLDKLDLLKAVGKDAMRLEYPGVAKDTRIVQYVIQWSQNFTLNVTFSCGVSASKERFAEFEAFVKSMKEKQ